MKKLLRSFLPAWAGMGFLLTSILSADAAPPIKIQGTIRDFQSRQLLPGISVRAKGSVKGTMTDVNGKFSLELPENEQTIVVSAVGYDQQEIRVIGRSELNIE